MADCADYTPHFLALINVAYPNWQGFDDPRLEKQELAYKREAIETAQARLSREALQHLIDSGDFDGLIGRVEEVGKSTNLLFLGVPRQGDLGILYHSDLDKAAFARDFTELIYGEGESPDRLQRFSDWAVFGLAVLQKQPGGL